MLDRRTRLVAVTAASNVGTAVDVARWPGPPTEWGRWSTWTPSITLPTTADIGALGADLLVASAYKFFGPHTGVLVGRLQVLEELDAYRLRPAPEAPPGKWETGTQSFESLAGVTAAVDYLASLGQRAGGSGDRRACSTPAWLRSGTTKLGYPVAFSTACNR